MVRPWAHELGFDAGPACRIMRGRPRGRPEYSKRQVAHLTGQISDQKYGRVNISVLSLCPKGPPATLGMFEPVPRPCPHIPTSGPSRPGIRAGLTSPMAGRPALGPYCLAVGRKRQPAFRPRPTGWPAGNRPRDGGLIAGALGSPIAAGRDGRFSSSIILLGGRLTDLGSRRLSRIEAPS